MSTGLTLIGLCGPAGAGKDTVADHLCQRFGFVRASFAEAPRQMLEALCSYANVDHAHLHERQLKERDMPVLRASYRRAMQTLGTEWGRLQMDMDLWVRVLESHLGLATNSPVHDRIVITDVRYPNEAEAIERWGGRLVGVTRPQAMAVRAHSSEAYIGTLWGRCQTLLVNDSSLPGLRGLIDGMAAELGLQPRDTLFPYDDA